MLYPRKSIVYAKNGEKLARAAVKEAVFKAEAHLTVGKSFDLRFVETLNTSDGCPYIKVNDYMKAWMNETKIDYIHVSITTEKDTVTAFVISEEYEH